MWARPWAHAVFLCFGRRGVKLLKQFLLQSTPVVIKRPERWGGHRQTGKAQEYICKIWHILIVLTRWYFNFIFILQSGESRFSCDCLTNVCLKPLCLPEQKQASRAANKASTPNFLRGRNHEQIKIRCQNESWTLTLTETFASNTMNTEQGAI